MLNLAARKIAIPTGSSNKLVIVNRRICLLLLRKQLGADEFGSFDTLLSGLAIQESNIALLHSNFDDFVHCAADCFLGLLV